jgi:hypothetical protein
MNPYLPWLLTVARILAIAAGLICWRMSYIASD